jgi:hypothetical protein
MKASDLFVKALEKESTRFATGVTFAGKREVLGIVQVSLQTLA